MKHGRWLAVLSAAAAISMSPAWRAHAGDGNRNFAVHGLGAQTCQAFLENVKKDNAAPALAVSWLMGYVTATNRLEADTYDALPVLDANVLLTLVANICEAHQQSIVETVASDILKTLSIARSRSQSPIVDAKFGDHITQIRADTLAEMQKKLAQLGYLKTEADGVFGESTAMALIQFQNEQKLPVTGIPDAPTIIRLLVETPAQVTRER